MDPTLVQPMVSSAPVSRSRRVEGIARLIPRLGQPSTRAEAAQRLCDGVCYLTGAAASALLINDGVLVRAATSGFTLLPPDGLPSSLEPAELARLSPDSENLIGYDWALASLRRDTAGADRALVRAQRAGVSLASVQRMQQATRRAELTRVVSFSLAGVLVLAAVAMLVRRRRELAAGLARRSTT